MRVTERAASRRVGGSGARGRGGDRGKAPGARARGPGKSGQREKRPGSREQRTFAMNVRLAREAAGLTQRDLARRAGLTQKWISEIELGHANPAIDTMAAVAAVVKVPVHRLLTPRST